MLHTFNSYNNRLQFTHDIETKNSISFLDILLIKKNQRIITNWYTKPTFSGRFLNYHSQHPLSQKIAMVYNVIDRAIKLADTRFHKDNINIAKNLLKENSYPTKFINKYISKRIAKLNNNTDMNNNRNQNKHFTSLPYRNRLF